MPSQPGIAAEGALPGSVLSPNSPDLQNLEDQGASLAQFGTELDKPKPVMQPNADQEDPNTKRFEYWHSQHDKEKQRADQLQAELAKRIPMDPLIDLVKSDDVSYRFLQDRLNGSRSTEKPLEPPQKPENFNEVEAYSNPESASFKWRRENEVYRDKLLQATIKQNERFYEQQQKDLVRQQQETAQREQLNKFRSEVVSKGIATDEFAAFFKWINEAPTDDLVKAYKYIQGQPNSQDQMFGIPPTASTGSRMPAPKSDIGSEIIKQSRMM